MLENRVKTVTSKILVTYKPKAFEKHVKKVWTVLCFDWLKNNSA